jgi:predicted dehydrogenase
MLRVASIGLGWWSDELAGAVQGKSDLIRVTSCFSRTPAKREAFASKFGTAQHKSFEAVLADPAIDAVILTTPHSLHASHVEAAAAAGKHVFVEKPFTLTAASGRAAAAACAKAGVVLAVGHNRRFAAAMQALKPMLDGGELGTLLHIETNFSAPAGLAYTPERWRASRIESPGGGLAGLGVHVIDLVAWLGGRIRRVNAQATRRAVSVDIDDTTSALFALESGATATLTTLMACPFTIFVNVYGTKANAFAAVDANRLEVQLPGQEPKPRAVGAVDTLKAELEEFALACGGRATYRIRPQDAIHAVAVMEAIVRSAAAEGSAVVPDHAGAP